AEIELKQFYHWLQKQVHTHGLHGYIREINAGQFEMVLAGNSKKELESFKNIWTGIQSYKVNIESEKEWRHPVKLGFELISDSRSLSVVELENKLKELKKEMVSVEKEKLRVQKRI